MQKYRNFIDGILDGTIAPKSSKYCTSPSYYSNILGGNPNIILINQLIEEGRTRNYAAPGSVSLPLPPFNKAGAQPLYCKYKIN